MSFRTIEFERDGVIGWLWLNRPEVLNAQNQHLAGEIESLLEDLTEDGEIRVLVVAGRGRAFSSGADLTEIAEGAPLPGTHVDRLAAFPMPTIAALHGHVIGGGLELALACDIRIAAEGTVFGMPEVSLGIIPGWGGTQRLPRIVGPGPAKELILTALPITAARADAMGLVNKVVSADALYAETAAYAASIAAHGPLALQYAKEAIHAGLDMTFAQGLELEGDLYVLLESTDDRREGIAAYREKRRPQWHGR